MIQIKEKVEELKSNLNNKLIKLNKIFDITKKQTDVINNYNVDELNKLIDQKQVLINEINELDKVFEDKFAKIKKLLGVDSLEQSTDNLQEFKVIQVFITEIKDVVKRIMELEMHNSFIAEQYQKQIKESMQNSKKDIRALNGYNSNNVQSSVFIDKKK